MRFIPHTVLFLVRATKVVGVICIFAAIVLAGMIYIANPNLLRTNSHEFFSLLHCTEALYLAPGLLLLLMAHRVQTGHKLAGAMIFLISTLSLFKLVLLTASYASPYLEAPLAFELPIRILCSFLSVACVYAWQDLSEMNRTRSRRPSRAPGPPAPERLAPIRPTTYPPPPPATRIPRPRLKSDEPPTSQTPWS